MTVTVAGLISELEQYDDDCVVRLMTQESWPFEHAISGVTSADAINNAKAEDGETGGFHPTRLPGGTQVVYVVEGEQLAYGDKRAWETR